MLLISTRQKMYLKLSSLAQFVFVSKCSFFAFTILSECTRMLRLFVKNAKKSCGGGCPQTPLFGFGMQTFSPPSNKFHQPPLLPIGYLGFVSGQNTQAKTSGVSTAIFPLVIVDLCCQPTPPENFCWPQCIQEQGECQGWFEGSGQVLP